MVLLLIHSEVSVYNFVKMRSYLTFLSYVIQGLLFSGHSVVTVNLVDQTDAKITIKVMQSGRQTVRRLIIFRLTCTPAILFWAHSIVSYHLILGILVKLSGV